MGFRIDDFNKPFASLAFDGATTNKPGIWENLEKLALPNTDEIISAVKKVSYTN